MEVKIFNAISLTKRCVDTSDGVGELKYDFEIGRTFSILSKVRNLGLILFIPLFSTCLLSYRLACAYYDPSKSAIFILEDTAESRHFDVLKLRMWNLTTVFAL